jgi:uncharacterized protein (TIGR01777 family)
MKVLLTGGTGLIGHEIGKKLVAAGHQVVMITRNKKKAQNELPFKAEVIEGDLSQAPVKNIPPIEAVIHLLGEPVAEGRWTADKKKRIMSSRIQSTQNLKASLGQQRVHVLSASAIGFYPEGGEQELNENSGPGQGFLAEVCQNWEKEAKVVSPDVTIFRIGLVLSPEGGALAKMLTPFRLGLGGAIGNGQQWMSWIHIEDLAEAFLWALKNKKTGTFNAVSPQPVRNKTFSQGLARSLHRPLGLNIPKIALKLLYGEMAEVIFCSQKVLPTNLLAAGFSFQHTDLNKTFEEILSFSSSKDLKELRQ